MTIFLVLCSAALADAAPYRFQWAANTDGVTAGYFVYYGDNPGQYQPVDGIDVGNVTEFNVDLTPGQTYYFMVRAYDADNNFGPPSNELAFAVPSNQTLSVSVTGSTVNAAVGNGPGNQLDFVGFYPVGSPVTSFLQRKYLNNSTTPGGNYTSGSVTFTLPTTPGQYVVRFVSSSNAILVASNPITVSSPTLTIGNATVTEGNSGTSVATFTVTLSPVQASQTVTVNYATANGTATAAGNDYTAATGTLTFSPSMATRTISVAVRGDTTVEQNETFLVNLSGATNATISDAQAIGTINNDDVPVGPAVNLTSTTVAPGGLILFTVSGGPANRTDWVTLSAAGAGDSSYVDWNYLNGSKTVPATGLATASLQFRAPSTPGNYNVRFFANNSIASRLAVSGTLSVSAQPAQPTLSIGNTTVTEGNAGASVATFTVTLSPVNATQTVTVNYATANGTASVANADYGAASGTLTFAPSTSTQTISVTIAGDNVVEPNETFTINLSGATNAALGDAQGVGTITNDDAPPGPAVAITSTSVAPGGLIQVSVTGGPGNRSDWVALSPASAADTNYLSWKYLNGANTLPATGVTSATLTFVAPNSPGNYNIRFFANNTLTRLAVSPTISVAAVAAQPTLTIGNATVTEGNNGNSVATFTVTLSPVSTVPVTVDYATMNGTATVANNDYAANSGTLMFAPSTATQTISVSVVGDTTSEANETFSVNLANAANATIGDAVGNGTIANDDAAAGPAVTLTSTTVAPGGQIQFTVSGGPGNLTDWVTLSAASAPDSSYIGWKYLNGANSIPSNPQTSATLQFTAPITPGTYNVRFFANNSIVSRLATSVNITVATQPMLSISNVTIAEGNSGTPMANFLVTLAPLNTTQTVTVDYATANGTATVANSDYAAANGTLTFSPSTATQTISVPVTGDGTIEPTETFIVYLSNATNAAIADAQAIGTITNDDGAAGPAVSPVSTTVQVGSPIQFVVSGGPGSPTDWVALAPAGAPDVSYMSWKYLNGANTVPASGQRTATLQFSAPTTPGSYTIRFYANNGFTRLARSATITVSP